MIGTISKDKIFQILFVLCISVPYFNNYELTFVIWLFTVIYTLQRKYSVNFLTQIFCFSAILAIAFCSSLFSNFKAYNFIRDITYFLKPIFGLLIGYQICKTRIKEPLKLVVNTGVIIALLHIAIIIYCFLILNVGDINSLRYYAGYFSDYEVYVLVFLFFSKELKIDISKSKRRNFIIILAISSLFYLSRTNFIQFVILFLAFKGFFTMNRRNITILTTIIVVISLGYSTILFINPKRNGPGLEAFLYKIKIAPTEPFKTKINREDYKDFNDNYRSVENILTFNQMTSEENGTIIFGKGLGSLVNLHTEVILDDTLLKEISILHNGFMTVFLKSGILGILILIYSITSLYRNCYFSDNKFKNSNYIFVGTIVFLFFSYWVFMGLYFKADTKSILIGLLIAYVERMKKRQLNNEALKITQ